MCAHVGRKHRLGLDRQSRPFSVCIADERPNGTAYHTETENAMCRVYFAFHFRHLTTSIFKRVAVLLVIFAVIPPQGMPANW